MTRADPQMKVRLTPELKERIELASLDNGRSQNAEILFRLEQSFERTVEMPELERAMIKTLTPEEFAILLDRVKRAGGYEGVNQRPSSITDQGPMREHQEGTRIRRISAPEAEADTISEKTVGRIADRVALKLADTTYLERMLEILSGNLQSDRLRIGDNSTPSRTPSIPGVNAPKRAPKKRVRRKPE